MSGRDKQLSCKCKCEGNKKNNKTERSSSAISARSSTKSNSKSTSRSQKCFSRRNENNPISFIKPCDVTAPKYCYKSSSTWSLSSVQSTSECNSGRISKKKKKRGCCSCGKKKLPKYPALSKVRSPRNKKRLNPQKKKKKSRGCTFCKKQKTYPIPTKQSTTKKKEMKKPKKIKPKKSSPFSLFSCFGKKKKPAHRYCDSSNKKVYVFFLSISNFSSI